MASELKPGERVVSSSGSHLVLIGRSHDYRGGSVWGALCIGPSELTEVVLTKNPAPYDPARHGEWRGPALPVPPAVREALPRMHHAIHAAISHLHTPDGRNEALAILSGVLDDEADRALAEIGGRNGR